MNAYINGQLKHNCSNIAQGKELKTSGDFILGQSHNSDDYTKRKTKQKIKELDPQSKQSLFDSYSSSGNDTPHQNLAVKFKPSDMENNTLFDPKLSFVGRLFNFNIWNQVPTRASRFIENIFHDCRLVYCGNAAQWSEYRPGTRGNVIMKWPTYLLWSSGTCLNQKYQQETCNKMCIKEAGPECRENIDKNFKWPTAKPNQTIQLKCFDSNINNITNSSINEAQKVAIRYGFIFRIVQYAVVIYDDIKILRLKFFLKKNLFRIFIFIIKFDFFI